MFECCATSSTEKSLVAKLHARHSERDHDEHELRARGRLGDGHQRGIAAIRTPQRQRALRERDEQRDDQREVADFRNHGFASLIDGMLIDLCFCAASSAAPASGGM